MSQTQLQELETTIQQRRLYLQGQDNQIQRNLNLLKNQKSQLSVNQAVLRKQSLKLKNLTTNSEKALKELKKRAEREGSAQLLATQKQIAKLESSIFSLKISETELQDSVKDLSDVLEQLDIEIIEADAIHKDLLDAIQASRMKLKKAERAAEFQVAIVSDLKNEGEQLQRQYEALEASRIHTIAEQERIDKLVKTAKTRLTDINNEIVTREKQLTELISKEDRATKSLDKIGSRDKVIRESLAEKELKIQEERADVKVRREAIKKQELANQEQSNVLKVPKERRNQGFYHI